MNHQELLQRVLSAHKLKIDISDPWLSSVEATVVTPDLRLAPRTVWGDWGPMYTVAVPPEQPIELQVCAEHGETVRHLLDLPRVKVESPMLCATRDVTPLYMEIPLAERRIRLRIYFDVEGKVAKAEAAPFEPGVSPFALQCGDEWANQEGELDSGVHRMASVPAVANANTHGEQHASG